MREFWNFFRNKQADTTILKVGIQSNQQTYRYNPYKHSMSTTIVIIIIYNSHLKLFFPTPNFIPKLRKTYRKIFFLKELFSQPLWKQFSMNNNKNFKLKFFKFSTNTISYSYKNIWKSVCECVGCLVQSFLNLV